MRESCGVVGVISKKKDASRYVYKGLITLQHRGQDSCGIVSLDEDRKTFISRKGYGLVTEVFKDFSEIAPLTGRYAIGHVRYPTVGSKGEPQPVEINYPMRGIVLAHNGNIANYKELKVELTENEFGFDTEIDAEVLLFTFVNELMKTYNDLEAIAGLMKKIDGSYSIVMLTGKNKLYAIRDPHGFKPLVYGKNDEVFMVASESAALDTCGVPMIGDVPPGGVLVADTEGYIIHQLTEPMPTHCVFEYIYFAHPESILNGIEVKGFRKRLGKILAEKYNIQGDVVIPVPYSSNPTAKGYSERSGIPYDEGLIKNQYIGRTFIRKSQEEREQSVTLKYNVVSSVVKGKRVIVIDDSIVRGTTMKKIVKLLREAGAKEIHVIISMPRIISPCFYGINITSYTELAAYNRTVDEINKQFVGADSLHYADIKDLYKAAGTKNLCVSCLTDKYPTKKANQLAAQLKHNGGKVEKRPWED